MKIKVVDVNEETGTMVIDWGWITLNHRIPGELVDRDDLTEDDVLAILRQYEPERPKPQRVGAAVWSLREKTKKERDYEALSRANNGPWETTEVDDIEELREL